MKVCVLFNLILNSSAGRRMRRISVPKETQDILEQHYQANPYPNRFEYLFMSRNANIDINRLKVTVLRNWRTSHPYTIWLFKNWFNNRRRADSRVGTLCRRCRCFKAPTNESHLDESGQFRPCHEVWNVLFQTKEANNNQVNSPPPQLQATSLVNGNYAQFMPHQQANPPLSTYVDAAALIRFMNAWQRSRNESLPFYQNQQVWSSFFHR